MCSSVNAKLSLFFILKSPTLSVFELSCYLFLY